MPKPLPPQAELLQLFQYEPNSGLLLWREREVSGPKVKAWNTRYAGKAAGAVWKTKRADHSYLQVSISKSFYPAHRVIWKMVTGLDPVEVDHINGNAQDNRWSNLRDISHAENMRNLKKKKNNTSGATGVRLDSRTGKYVAQVQHNNKQIRLGGFSSFDNAVEAVAAKHAELGFSATHGQER